MKEEKYYSNTNNFITCTATIDYAEYSAENGALYLSFDHVPNGFSEDDFKIIEENLDVIRNNGGESVLEVGNEITFVSAPRYFGNGYVMPIVFVSKDQSVYLDFETGYTNFMHQYD